MSPFDILDLIFVCICSVAWETTSPQTEEPGVSSRAVRVNATAPVLEELPGSVPERREVRAGHSTQVERYRDNRQGEGGTVEFSCGRCH